MPRYYDIDKLAEMLRAKADTLVEGKEAFLSVEKWLGLLPAADVVPWIEAEKWYSEYQAIKFELMREKTEHKATDKLADKYFTELQTAKSEIARKIFAEIRNILSDDSNDSEETMAYDEQAAAYYEAELCRIVEQIKQLEKRYEEGGE